MQCYAEVFALEVLVNKITLVSRIFRFVFQAILILVPLSSILFWLNAPVPFSAFGKHVTFAINYIPQGVIIAAPLTNAAKVLGFLISMIPITLYMCIGYCLIKVFKNFETNHIFDFKNVLYIKRTGYLLLIAQIIAPFYQALLSLNLTWNNPPPLKYIVFYISGVNLVLLFISLLIILIAWIMAEGYKLHEETKYTV